MASVRFEGISKIYQKDILALAEFDLEVKDGELLVLVGPSGCGKSTALRLLAGLEEPATGELFINNQSVRDKKPQDRDIAMVFQNYALYPHMTVFDNMAFSLRMKKMSKELINKNVKETAEILGISDYLYRKPRELSGGQRQRVAVGRAIVRHPSVFLFDEPLSNLDAKLRVQMRNELSRLHTRLEATMIYVTHDQAEAMTLGDRIVVLKDGYIQQIASPLDLYDFPENSFVAGFIGSPSMNFLPVSLENSVLRSGNNLIPTPMYADVSDGEYMFGIRPEDIYPAADAPHEGQVEVLETLGNENIIYMRFSGRQFTVRCGPKVHAVPGEPLRFSMDIQRSHLFDPDGIRVKVDV
ncbi:MAG: sn-glycerol-3-phosphate ABC transporter ATP-binding protein UgpC [Candidatus Fermentibacteraceae bacterium]|nr:sn-glycerol-3-phosphate ABC transporter ATP-binding protein UgpC [Candidatus Fermentibacteraceae bacterium]